VDWSNKDISVFEPFSLEAALQTYQDRTRRRLSDEDIATAKQLLLAVDLMPLAVSLLGQLSRRENSVADLLARWNREHTSLLSMRDTGRENNVGVSIKVSIDILRAADETHESLRLLALCSMVPGGLRREVFDKLRPELQYIDRARDNLHAYSLASLSTDGTFKTLSPVRHYVLEWYPPDQGQREALCSIYFDIARQLPIHFDDRFEELGFNQARDGQSVLSVAHVSQAAIPASG